MTLTRSLLFVPGDDEARLDAAVSSAADAVVLDLEDSVGPAAKEGARARVRRTVREWESGQTCIVRINGLDTDHGVADVTSLVESGAVPDVVLVPDVRDATELELVGDVLDEAAVDVPLLALLERPEAVLRAHRIARSTTDLFGLAFGSVDFQANMGMDILDSETDLFPPKYQIGMAASAAGVGAFDTVLLDTGDEARLREEATTARMLGYDGKLVVTPEQASVVNDVFTPSREAVGRAQRIVETFEAAGEDTGLVEFEGTLVDEPVVVQQRDLLSRAREAGVDVD